MQERKALIEAEAVVIEVEQRAAEKTPSPSTH